MPAVMALRRWLMVGLAGAALGGGPAALDTAMVRFKARAAEERVVAALREARALALARGKPVRVVVDEGLRAVWVEGGHWRRLPEGVSLAGPQPDRNGRGIIEFAADGTSRGGQVVVGWRGLAAAVLVDAPSGHVRRLRAEAARPPS